MSEYKCTKCLDKQNLYSHDRGIFTKIKCDCEYPKKSDWLQFSGATIRKSEIKSYWIDNPTEFRIVVKSGYEDEFREFYETEQEAQARFDEIDKLIRGE